MHEGPTQAADAKRPRPPGARARETKASCQAEYAKRDIQFMIISTLSSTTTKRERAKEGIALVSYRPLSTCGGPAAYCPAAIDALPEHGHHSALSRSSLA